MSVADALAQLQFCEKKAANYVEEVSRDVDRLMH
jgi:hypothetical protein